MTLKTIERVTFKLEKKDLVLGDLLRRKAKVKFLAGDIEGA